MSMHNEISKLVKRLEREFGYTVTNNKSGHYRVSRPGYSQVVTVSGSPNGGNRALRNIAGDLKRYLGIHL